MKPDNPDDRRPHSPLVPQRPLLHGPHVPAREEAARKAATNIARNQLEHIYDGHTATPTPQTTPVAPQAQPVAAERQQQPEEAANPYRRTHAGAAQVQAEQWKKYHSAWQQYYQQYYERYYVGQVYQARQELATRARDAADKAVPKPAEAERPQPETLSQSEAMYDLRSKLRGKLQTSAKKARKSRHFVPITAAVCVMLVFLFLQFNRVIFSNVQAYISPGDIDPANIIVDPTADIPVGPEPKLIIPKINVDVPVNYDTTPDYDAQMKAMENGVAWFGIPGANSKPGQVGNTVLSGHSSNDIIDSGSYKFIFARLDHMQKGDTVYVNYESKRYTYTVTKKEVVKPTDVQALVYKTDKPVLTLITCTPLGTSLNRLLVTAEQVSPNPDDAKAAPEKDSNSKSAAMPGNSPTFVERLFGN